MEDNQNDDAVLRLSAMVVAAYVQHNSVPRPELIGLIERTHMTLSGLGKAAAAVVVEKPIPAVSVKKSVTADAIICLEDGKAFKSLRRHLRAAFNMTPDEYRAKWGLPADYPMVAPSYAEARSKMAKSLGLGRARLKRPEAVAPIPVEPPKTRRKKAVQA